MKRVIYIYDCKKAREYNARRVAFTKELYGFVYRWKTRNGVKQRRRPGLLEAHPGTEIVSDSAVLVPEEARESFDAFFARYSDILKVSDYVVLEERRRRDP
jgi:hypothetical protein